jgi:hypothetical protein
MGTPVKPRYIPIGSGPARGYTWVFLIGEIPVCTEALPGYSFIYLDLSGDIPNQSYAFHDRDIQSMSLISFLPSHQAVLRNQAVLESSKIEDEQGYSDGIGMK